MLAADYARRFQVFVTAGFVLVLLGTLILSLTTFQTRSSGQCPVGSLGCPTLTFTVQPLAIGSAVGLVWFAAVPLLYLLLVRKTHLATIIGPVLVLLVVATWILTVQSLAEIILSSAFWFLAGTAFVVCGSALEIAAVVWSRMHQIRGDLSQRDRAEPPNSAPRPTR